MHFLAVETSCDETAAAVFTDEPRVLANVVASQTDLHARFGGVVPEVAARAHLQRLLPVIDEALRKADVRLDQIGAMAVHNTPGLVGALLVGVSAAKMLAVALNVPLIAVNHVEAHIYDAAGEAFDKVAALLGLGFPGGPAVEREAVDGDPTAFRFPRSFLHEDRLDFSFSGLKTAVLYACYGQNAMSPPPLPAGQKRADAAASFQQAVIDVLVGKSRQALRRTGLKRLAVGGGVAANKPFRAALERMAAEEGAELFIPPMTLCTDNAAMAAQAVEKWRRQMWAPLDLDARPNYGA